MSNYGYSFNGERYYTGYTSFADALACALEDDDEDYIWIAEMVPISPSEFAPDSSCILDHMYAMADDDSGDEVAARTDPVVLHRRKGGTGLSACTVGRQES